MHTNLVLTNRKNFFIFVGAAAERRLWPTHSRGFSRSHTTTQHNPQVLGSNFRPETHHPERFYSAPPGNFGPNNQT